MRVLTSFPVVFATMTAAVLGACNGQGEGNLCNTSAGNQGNDDCQSGLTCQSKPNIVTNPFGICCPPSGPSTSSNCSNNVTLIDANPAPVTGNDGGNVTTTPDGASSDAPAGDASDASVE